MHSKCVCGSFYFYYLRLHARRPHKLSSLCFLCVYVVHFISFRATNEKAAYRVPISRFFIHFYTMIATSFHGIAKSFCATTK